MPTKIYKALQTAVMNLDGCIEDLEAIKKLLEAIEHAAKEGQTNPEKAQTCCEAILQILSSFQFL